VRRTDERPVRALLWYDPPVHSATAELRDALPGTVIEGTAGVRYHLREVIGEGGQGWVYKANYDDPDGVWVVVKVLRPESVSDALQRFQREAEVLRRLGAVPAPNPNIVRFFDYGVHPVATSGGPIDLPFITLEHVEGQTLASVIRAHGGFGLPITRARRIMKQVARALGTVHEQRLIHRDLKPSNILLASQNGQEIAKVTDFGLVKLPELTAKITLSFAGFSHGYAPPEQYEIGNNHITAQTDVFSFASVLFEVLCGTEAFPVRSGDNPLKILARMITGERPSLARGNATVPRELRERSDLTAALDREIGRALSADPALRHASIRELWDKIEPLLVDAGYRGRALLVDDPANSDAGQIPAPAPPPAAPAPEWRVAARHLTGDRLRSAVIAEDRQAIIAVGLHGLYRFSFGAWASIPLPAGVDVRFIRGALLAPRGEVILYGDGGFAATLARSGAVERFPISDRDLTILGAHTDDKGTVFVGERLSRAVGVLIEILRGASPALRAVEGTVRLHGVTRLHKPGAAYSFRAPLVLCGTHGALIEVDGTAERAIAWGRTGHLYAVAATPDGGAYAVGSGGHALRISPSPSFLGTLTAPTATLEAVQTTRDLHAVALDEDDVAWAAGSQGRLLQRRENYWTRVALDPSVQGSLVAVRPCRDGITVVTEEGMVLEGPGASAP
jgi:eukaryotic-like serine/threonine-protein kinase